MSNGRRSRRARNAVVVLPVGLLVLAAACTGSAIGAKQSSGSSAATTSPTPVKRTEGYDNSTFQLGPRSPFTRPTDPPPPATLPSKTPIDHVICVVKENRTFDTYFA